MARVIVSRHGVEAVRRGHPWIFRSATGHLSSRERDARIVTIVSERDEPVGTGVYDPDSPIAVRVWGVGADTHLDASVFNARLKRALELRRELFADGTTTAYRLLNGEGDRTPGYVIDRYGDVAVLRIDGEAARAVAPILLRDVESTIREAGITTLLERTSQRSDRDAKGGDARGHTKSVTVRFGHEPTSVRVTEHGVPFLVDVMRGQKTGAFLDQRENRRRVGELVARRKQAGLGVRVLNLFSYSGGFSQRAALGGGIVTSVDVAAKAHVTAQQSFKLAGIDLVPHAFVTADAFAWLADQKKKGHQWDVVISDPPSFAPSERAKPNAISAYRALHRACADVLAPGGTLVAASCSSHVSAEDFLGTLDDIALGRSDLRLLDLFGPPPDHPTLPSFPEGRYLKLALLA